MLQQRYKAAQDYQAAHQLDQAAGQYRIFLADALGQLARGEDHAGRRDEAANEFEEALTLVPEFPALRLEYARSCFARGDLARAQREAERAASANDPKLAATAHNLLGRILLAQGKNAEGKREMEQAVALDATFENGYGLAVAELDAGDGDGAAKIFAEMRTSFGDTAQLHMLFGQAYGGSDFQSRAVDEFRAAIALDGKLPGAHYSLASALLATSGDSKSAEAEAELRKETGISPENGAAWAALGHLVAAHNPEEAAADLQKGTVLDPSNPDTWFYLGQFLADTHQADAAIPALRKSIALTAEAAHNNYQVRKAHYLLGRLLTQSGHAEEGRAEIAASQALMQQNITRDRGELASYLGDPGSAAAHPGPSAAPAPPPDPAASSAVDALRRQLAPTIADSYNNLGAIAGSQRNYPVALHYFRRAEEWNPALPGLDLNWGRAALAANQPAEAVGPLARSLAQSPGDHDTRGILGLSQFFIHDYASARTTLAPLADGSQATPQIAFAYAKSLALSGDLAGGIARLQTLARATPESAEIHCALGEAYTLAHSPEAAGELDSAIRLDPRNVEAHEARARLALEQGDARAAVAQLEIALRLDPRNPDLQRELDRSRARLP